MAQMKENNSLMATPYGSFKLMRHAIPQTDPRENTLRAWSAADEYLLEYVADRDYALNENIVIVNDEFGGLTVPLAKFRPSLLSDSYVSHRAVQYNLQINDIPLDNVKLLSPFDELNKPIDFVFIHIPKTLALLEYQLMKLRGLLNPESKIIASAMIKHLPSSAIALFEKLIGPTTTSLAQKKARLIFADPLFAENHPVISIDESIYPVRYTLENTDYVVTNHANVFSRDQLDIGTRFFISAIPEMAGATRIVDLGCGNGIVGLIAAERNPQAEILFIDESFMAVESAKDSYSGAQLQKASLANRVQFVVDDCLSSSVEAGSVDLVLCNPPFHQQNVVGDGVAWRMFTQSKRALRKGGELWVIGNRHLNYHSKLKRIFSAVQIVDSNSKFVICRAIC